MSPWRPSNIKGTADILPTVNQLLRETNFRVDGALKAIPRRIKATANLNFGTSIAANTTIERTLQVPGALQTGTAHVSPVTLLNSSLVWSSAIFTTNVVHVRLCNPTAGAITIPNPIQWNCFINF